MHTDAHINTYSTGWCVSAFTAWWGLSSGSTECSESYCPILYPVACLWLAFTRGSRFNTRLTSCVLLRVCYILTWVREKERKPSSLFSAISPVWSGDLCDPLSGLVDKKQGGGFFGRCPLMLQEAVRTTPSGSKAPEFLRCCGEGFYFQTVLPVITVWRMPLCLAPLFQLIRLIPCPQESFRPSWEKSREIYQINCFDNCKCLKCHTEIWNIGKCYEHGR